MDISLLYERLITYGGNVLLAVIFLIIGLKLIKFISRKVAQKLEKAGADPTLASFVAPLVRAVLLILLIISIASMLGIAVASFVAVLAAASFAVGLALQGSLSNFAGGVLILILKPFKVDDYIEA